MAASLLVLALLGTPRERTYYWRDTSGQTHITNAPPPADAEVLEAPAPPGVAPGKAAHPELVRQSASRGGYRKVTLSLRQQQAWEALDQRLAKARGAGDRGTLETVAGSLISDCLWGNGLWAMPMVPVLAVALMGLLGWWLALGLPGPQAPWVAGFLLLGLAFGHVLLNVFLYHPQSVRLRQNLELLEQHMGTGRDLRPENRALLQRRYQALEQATEPLQAPWHFPVEVRALRVAIQQVMVEP
jgi:hypothetical protein